MKSDMPGESFWVPVSLVQAKVGYFYKPGDEVRVMGGQHGGKLGVVRAVDGSTDMIQVRTGDPEKWAAWDAETRRMIGG